MRLTTIIIALSFSLLSFGQERGLLAYSDGGVEEHSLTVCAEPSSGLFTVKVASDKKIGNIRIQVRNSNGKVIYSEVGKAKTNEMVRYIDKSIFKKGEYKVEVFTKQFNMSQAYNVR